LLPQNLAANIANMQTTSATDLAPLKYLRQLRVERSSA
jgi:hypothetical protein